MFEQDVDRIAYYRARNCLSKREHNTSLSTTLDNNERADGVRLFTSSRLLDAAVAVELPHPD